MPAKVVTHIRVAKKSDVTLLNFDFIIAFPPVKIEKHTVSLRCAFVDKVLGDGFAVIPADGRIYAPADGEVAMVFDTLHAVTLTSTQGAEILIHIGLDTVTLKGEPFKAHVAAGDKVKKGDLLIEADLDKIEKAGLNTIIPVLICNTDDYGKISLQKEGDVSADEAVLKLS